MAELFKNSGVQSTSKTTKREKIDVSKSVDGTNSLRVSNPNSVAQSLQNGSNRPKIGDSRPAPKIKRIPIASKVSRGKKRGRVLGRYLACVHKKGDLVQLAILEGRSLIEHYATRVNDGISEILGNVYLGRVNNVLPGMEAAFVDIGTPKNAVLYKGDVREDIEELDSESLDRDSEYRIEEVLKPGQEILCQVIKNPIGVKGARLSQEINLPGRFVVVSPGGNQIGVSKRLADQERRRLRKMIESLKPDGFRVIVRTAAEGASKKDIEADLKDLLGKWNEIQTNLQNATAPTLLYQEPHMVLRVLREDLSEDYRAIYVDDKELYSQAKSYVASFNSELARRIHYYDVQKEGIALFEKFYVQEQLHKALDKKIWLPSGGSIIIEHTEALTVIDVNTAKNVGSSNLEETVYKNNLEAAEEVARQLRLRDIGGIIVIDFIDMESETNRINVVSAFRQALARDKTKTQVTNISELGLVEMTRKRIGEGLIGGLTTTCPHCDGQGFIVQQDLLKD